MGRKYCKNCESYVKPEKKVSMVFLIILFCLGVIPGLVYYALADSVCPKCGLKKWGEPPEKE